MVGLGAHFVVLHDIGVAGAQLSDGDPDQLSIVGVAGCLQLPTEHSI